MSQGQDIEQYRAGFEAWAREKCLPLDRYDSNSEYFMGATQAAWDAWTAAKREASTEPSYARPKDHEIRQLVNDLRAIAEKFHAHGCLRDTISRAVGQFIDANYPAGGAQKDEAKDAARYRFLRDSGDRIELYITSGDLAGDGVEYLVPACLDGETADRAIDAAIAHTKAQEKKA